MKCFRHIFLNNVSINQNNCGCVIYGGIISILRDGEKHLVKIHSCFGALFPEGLYSNFFLFYDA